jgi:CheY-like chemotaxis protein
VSRRLVLVIDAHEDSRIIVRTIAQFAGFDVVDASHAERGIELMQERAPDVVIVDLDESRLPPGELTTLLQRSARRSVPVIGLGSPPIDRAPAGAGLAAFIHKPIGVDAPLNELRRVTTPLDA